MEAKRERYTPNDVGPIPNDWSAPKLSDVSTLITNGFVGTATPHYTDSSGIPYLFGKNVRPNRIDPEGIRYITNSFHEKQSKTKLETGDLLTVQSGHIGETAVVPSTLSGANCHALIVTRLLKERVLPMFMSYYLNSEIGRARMVGLEVGSTILHINTKDLKKFRVIVPPLGEQKKIAQILSTWDKAITTTEQLLANSQQQKKALMQQLLTGKKRLLDENGVRFSGEWVSLQLGEFTEITTGKSKSKFVTEDGQNFIVDMGSVNRQGKLVPSKRTNLDSDYLQVGHLVMPKDDIGGGNILGRAGYITENNKFILGDHVYALKVSENDSLFISYLINSYAVNKSLRRKANGTAQLGLGKKDVLRQVIHIPSSNSEQQSIASVLFRVDQEISKLQFKVASLKTEKKALMQQLLTGKRRVKVDEEAA